MSASKIGAALKIATSITWGIGAEVTGLSIHPGAIGVGLSDPATARALAEKLKLPELDEGFYMGLNLDHEIWVTATGQPG